MRSKHYPIVARQGLWLILPLSGAGLLLLLFHQFAFSLPVWLAVGVIAFLFRDPERRIPAKPLGIVAPVDGRVIAMQEMDDPYLERRACWLKIAGSAAGSYVVRSPMEGKLQKQWYATPSDIGNSRAVLATWIQSDEGDDILLLVRPRLAWLRLHSDVVPGERTGQGMRLCYSPFGAEIEIWMPLNTHIDVRPGQRIHSGSDVIGILNHGS